MKIPNRKETEKVCNEINDFFKGKDMRLYLPSVFAWISTVTNVLEDKGNLIIRSRMITLTEELLTTLKKEAKRFD